MKRFCIIIFLLTLAITIQAQITFQKTFSINYLDYGQSVKQTFDGGYIITGGDFLIKTDENGDTLWTKTFMQAFQNCATDAFCVEQTNDSGYIITGAICALATVEEDIFLIKTNSTGDTLWTKTYGGSSNDVALSVHQTTDGGYIIIGYTYNFGAVHTDTYLIKTDFNGSILWTKTFGGAGYDQGNSVEQTSDQGYIITGSCDGGYPNVYLVKTDSIGNLIWSKSYGGAMSDVGISVKQTTDGGYIIAGVTNSIGIGGTDVYLIKTDSLGNLLWTKVYGGVNSDSGREIQQTTDGGYIVIGDTRTSNPNHTHAFLIKTDSLGDTLWTQSFRFTDALGRSVQQTNDGGYIITGQAWDTVSATNLVYLIKTTANGESGCNQENIPVIVAPVGTPVIIPVTSVSSGSVIKSNSIVLGNNCTVTTICTTVDVHEVTTDNSLSIFPNPVTNKITISNFNFPISEIEIYNVMGQRVFQSAIANQQSTITIGVEEWNKGIYVVKMSDGEKRVVKKVVVQ